ncbi:MAG: hypothetical protein J7K49_05305 [Thaumarchaeota archaeon]|nr:hypothetical protein [Nitrososphaerota archaeon]
MTRRQTKGEGASLLVELNIFLLILIVGISIVKTAPEVIQWFLEFAVFAIAVTIAFGVAVYLTLPGGGRIVTRSSRRRKF